MPKFEHGVYEPSSEDVRVFDGGEDDIDEEGSRLPLLIVIALLVLAAFAGVVWLAYNQGVQRGREGAPRVIAAESGPVRTAPQNPGGTTPYQGLKIYEQPAPADEEGSSEAPAPKAVEAPKPAAEEPKPAAEAPKPAPAETPVVKKAEAPALRQAEAKPAPAPAKPAPAAEAAAGSAYVLQIGAYKSEDEANGAWKIYERKHPVVGGYAPDVLRVDLGDKGVWYRLRVGGFADKAAANAMCDKLKADGGGCFPAKK